MTPAPLVTVIVPAFDAVATLAETLHAALAQEDVTQEILVVDDGSRDGTAALVASFPPPVRLIRQANQGVGAARNRGLAEARGRYVAFLDADDVWEPDKLRQQLAAAARQQCGLCYTGVTLIDEQGRPVPDVPWTRDDRRPEGWVFRELLFAGNALATSSVLVERRRLEQVGPFVTDRGVSEDYEMWLRLARVTCFCFVPQPLVRYRIARESFSHGDPVAAHRRCLAAVELAARHARLDPADAPRLRRRRADILYELAYTLRSRGQRDTAARWLLRSLGTWPLAPRTLLALLALLVPAPLQQRLARLRRPR